MADARQRGRILDADLSAEAILGDDTVDLSRDRAGRLRAHKPAVSDAIDALLEASLVLALSRGKSIAEAAEAMNLTVGSARTYTKRIYAKTGARGQSDLIRFIHRSVMALT